MVELAREPLHKPEEGGSRHYKIQRLINRGNFAQVYLALDENTQKEVALKIITTSSRQAEESIAKEMDISVRAVHPAIIRTYEAFKDSDGQTYIAQELAKDGDLYDYLMEHGSCKPHEEQRLKDVFKQIASALDYLHNTLHVVHRDVKLENVCIVRSENPTETPTVRLLDFGLAEEIPEDGKLRIRPGLVGTSVYIAPEVVSLRRRGGVLCDPTKQDSFALGVMLYALLTGNFPWDEANENDLDYADFAARLAAGESGAVFGIDPSKLGLSQHVAELLHGLLEPEPSKRLTPMEAVEKIIDLPWFVQEITVGACFTGPQHSFEHIAGVLAPAAGAPTTVKSL
eukprot:comp26368_c0_seq1/m.47100 comp26368_c0_seq1/g.47100  ORF comp26368_c0_seq1/g.47100 comp26368_c0_seq1/m.47100 type:complete len:342 (-) comp26368_c0_seq1:452-1477(-)